MWFYNVGILGITYTGKLDNMVKLDDLVEEYNKSDDFMRIYKGGSYGVV